MELKLDDVVVIIDPETERKCLVRVYKDLGDGDYKGRLANIPDGDKIGFGQGDVLANLGADPPPLSFAGVKAELWKERIKVDGIGIIDVYRDLPKAEKDTLIKNITKAIRKIKKYKVDTFLPVNWEIRPKKGRWAGSYHYNTEIGDKIVLHTDSIIEGGLYTILHEFGHGVYFRSFDPSHKAMWVKAYHEAVERKDLKFNKIQALGKQFVKSGDTISVFRKDLDDEAEQELFDQCLGWITSVHFLKKSNINDLIEGGDEKEILKLWPTEDIVTSDIDHTVSEYGSVNPEEFWAEAFAFFFMDKKLPSKIKKLVKKTLKKVRRK